MGGVMGGGLTEGGSRTAAHGRCAGGIRVWEKSGETGVSNRQRAGKWGHRMEPHPNLMIRLLSHAENLLWRANSLPHFPARSL